MRKNLSVITAGVLAFACGVLYFPGRAVSQGERGYVGSKTCGMCHPVVSKTWMNSGHAKMLRQIVNGAVPDNADVKPPEGKTWNDLSYLVGGASYYARFIDSKGYVVTGPKAQWSMVGKTLTAYDAQSAPGTEKYDCIKCHVTGWKDSGAYPNVVKNSLEGIPGVWNENGVGCESCHGPGSEHVALKNLMDIKKANGDLKIKVDKSMENCGACHQREDGKISLASKDLVESRQQFTEMKLNMKGKAKMTCIFCHNSHVSSMSKEGISKTCETCHPKVAVKIQAMASAGVKCLDCHMPFADRGAYDSMVKAYHRGDTRTHIFGISADPKYVLDDGTGHAALNSNGLARLTVEMTCYSCHKAGKAPDFPREKFLAMAPTVHK